VVLVYWHTRDNGRYAFYQSPDADALSLLDTRAGIVYSFGPNSKKIMRIRLQTGEVSDVPLKW